MNCILNDIATSDLIFYFSDYVFSLLLLPCEQRFLYCMAFSVYEVICVACVSRSWFVLIRPVTNLSLLHSRFYCRHATLLPSGEERWVTTLKMAV